MRIFDYGAMFHVQLDHQKNASFGRQLKAVKAIPGKAYVPEGKVWQIPGDQRPAVETLAATFKVELIDPFQPSVNFDNIPPMPEVPADLLVPVKGTPRHYQLQGVVRALELQRCIIGDDQGLGKTLEAIATLVTAAAQGHDVFPCLVVCPSNAKENWRREWAMWTNKSAMVLQNKYLTSWSQYWHVGEAQVFICNFESVHKYFVQFMPPKGEIKSSQDIVLRPGCGLFKSIIVDELHRCKDHTTRQSRVTLRLAQFKKWRLGLTGTPLVNSPLDLFSQLSILGRLAHFAPTLAAFKRRYCAGDQKASNLKELNYLLATHCFFRREKKDVATELPEKQRQKYICTISNRLEYDKALNHFRLFLEHMGKTETQVQARMKAEALQQMMELKRLSERGKAAAVQEFAQEVLDSGNKLILFCSLKDTVRDLKKLFPDAVTITGDDNDEAKQRSIDRFQTDPTVLLCIANIKAAGTSITLTASSRVGFVGWPWTFADCVQCEDRTHRIGQRNAVMCTYFMGEGTIDEDLYDIVQTKKELANAVTGGTDAMEMSVVDAALNLFNQKMHTNGHKPDAAAAPGPGAAGPAGIAAADECKAQPAAGRPAELPEAAAAGKADQRPPGSLF